MTNDDLVTRLRHSAQMVRIEWIGAYENPTAAQDLEEAANRIEELESVIASSRIGWIQEYEDGKWEAGWRRWSESGRQIRIIEVLKTIEESS